MELAAFHLYISKKKNAKTLRKKKKRLFCTSAISSHTCIRSLWTGPIPRLHNPPSDNETTCNVQVTWSHLSQLYMTCKNDVLLGVVFQTGKVFYKTPLVWVGTKQHYWNMLSCIQLYVCSFVTGNIWVGLVETSFSKY